MEEKIGVIEGVDVEISGLRVRVKGPKGEISRDFSDPRYIGLITLKKDDSSVSVSLAKDTKKAGAVAGTILAHIRNMMIGVSVGYKYNMKIMHTHFPITVTVSGKEIHIKNFLGEKGLRIANVMGDTEVKADKETVTLTGINVEDIGQTAANIERACKLTGRDRRVFQDGIYLSGRRLMSDEHV